MTARCSETGGKGAGFSVFSAGLPATLSFADGCADVLFFRAGFTGVFLAGAGFFATDFAAEGFFACALTEDFPAAGVFFAAAGFFAVCLSAAGADFAFFAAGLAVVFLAVFGTAGVFADFAFFFPAEAGFPVFFVIFFTAVPAVSFFMIPPLT